MFFSSQLQLFTEKMSHKYKLPKAPSTAGSELENFIFKFPCLFVCLSVCKCFTSLRFCKNICQVFLLFVCLFEAVFAHFPAGMFVSFAIITLHYIFFLQKGNITFASLFSSQFSPEPSIPMF